MSDSIKKQVCRRLEEMQLPVEALMNDFVFRNKFFDGHYILYVHDVDNGAVDVHLINPLPPLSPQKREQP